MLSESYTSGFYERLRGGATRSAEVIVPLVLQLLPTRSVVDIGCGDGSWLAVFRKHGVGEILGVDGEYVDRDLLQIPPECFRVEDLTRPFAFGTAFDLAISLEVAEHLPAECAPVFVECLTKLAPVVLFSAAIPSQGGEHHVNEQWPDVWAALFERYSYLPVDFVRRRVWENEAVDWWYAQNTFLYAQAKVIESNAALNKEFDRTDRRQLNLVHPKRYLQAIVPPPPMAWSVWTASHLLLRCIGGAMRRRLLSPSRQDPRT